MIDLADLDRRAALAMGDEELDRRWNGISWSPTTDANDCREFVQWAINHHDGWGYDLHIGRLAADCIAGDIWGNCGSGEATKGESPTYDLVAQVLAVLAALEVPDD